MNLIYIFIELFHNLFGKKLVYKILFLRFSTNIAMQPIAPALPIAPKGVESVLIYNQFLNK